ncbi:hypothetical protein BOTBODRAFT_54181 [Botryobasidium botryosum FD-172 SS1]|uniref:Fungal-type protein kinase domain-containing protein n=1 Tax=Botryobasidium botryosum (strain FD-172 SS1) TaxID=930990 RepID=A0A067MJT1_BOTB1|nr:hypothetical protein BOTBODRAFT_54181 [Botryobasidium botryosum FD-172 SS1]
MFHGTGSEGNTGRVADLDLAADTGKLWREGERTEGDVRTGTHAYQSYKILSQADESLPLGPHDHMDDLESFFYVLCHISAMVKGPKTREIPDLAGHPELRKWVLSSDETPDFKLKVIHERILYVRCTEYFARYKDLLDKLRYFFWPRIAIAQDAVVDSKPMPNLEWPLEERLERAKADYDGFTEIVSEFIELLGPDATDSVSTTMVGCSLSLECVNTHILGSGICRGSHGQRRYHSRWREQETSVVVGV